MKKLVHRKSDCNLAIPLALMIAGNVIVTMPVEAKAKGAKSDATVNGGSQSLGNAALDKTSLDLINLGKWKELAVHLKERLAKGKFGKDMRGRVERSYVEAWLAFAYMYNAQKNECVALLAQVEQRRPAIADVKTYEDAILYANGKAVEALADIALNKTDIAEAIVRSIPGDIKNQLPAGVRQPDPADEALYNIVVAAVYGKKGQPRKAIDYSLAAYKADPRFAWAMRTVGYLRLRWLKDSTGAESALTQALAVEPRLTEARDMLVDVKLLRNDFDGAIALSPEPFKLASIYMQQWRLNEARAQLDKAIALDGNQAKYYRSRAAVYKLQQNLPAAIADQMRAVDLSQDKAFELTELANLNLLAGHPDKAIDNFKAALAIKPNNAPAREKLFNLLFEEKRFDDLAVEYRAQIAANPNSAELHMGLGAILMQLNQDKDAIAEFETAAALSPMDPQPSRQLGAFYLSRKNYAMAAKAYTAALNVMPTSVKDLVALGYCYAQNDDYSNAEAAFVTALALQQLAPSNNPDEPSRLDIMRSLGYLLYDEGRYADSTTQFQNLVTVFKDSGITDEDYLHLLKARLLRDLAERDAQMLMDTYNRLSDDRREALRYSLIETYLEAEKPEFAARLLAQAADDADPKDPMYPLYFLSRLKLQRLENKLEIAKHEAQAADDAVLDNLIATAGKQDQILASRLYVERARRSLEADRPDEARTAAEAAIKSYDKNFVAHLIAAQAEARSKDYQKAQKHVEAALAINPHFAQAYLIQGEIYLEAGKKSEAVEAFKKACEVYPASIEAHQSLLGAFKSAGMLKEAQLEQEQIARMKARKT